MESNLSSFNVDNPLMAAVIRNRGYDDEFFAALSDSEHGKLLGVDKLASELHAIHDANERLVIYPDFDMDGIMSGTVLYAGLSELGFNVGIHIPDPDDGYGMNRKGIDAIRDNNPDVTAIITCDVGITANAAIAYAKSKGIRTLVTDHHTPNDTLPDAMVCVDPMREDDPYEHPQICGAYVAWQCLFEYAETYCDTETVRAISRLRVFAGIGTVSDMMPLLYENRQLVKDTVTIMRFVYGNDSSADRMANVKRIAANRSNAYRRAFEGLHHALRGILDGKFSQEINEETLGFYLAPTFNAVKRMGGDMKDAFGMFLSNRQEERMARLIAINEERKQEVEAAWPEIAEQIYADPSRMVFKSAAKPGIVGLLATRALRETNRPAIVVTKREDGSWGGSGRSPEWFDALSALREHGLQAAGHAGAFGFSMYDFDSEADTVDAVLSDGVEKAYADGKVIEETPDFRIGDGADADSPFDSAVLLDFADELDAMRPFGRGFEKPHGVCSLDLSEHHYSVIGSDGKHAKFTIDGVDILLWNQAEKLSKMEGAISIDGSVGVNVFKGKRIPTFTGEIK